MSTLLGYSLQDFNVGLLQVQFKRAHRLQQLHRTFINMVDIVTYRCRIGRFKGRSVTLIDMEILRVVGVVGFVGLLLFIAGVELNPGPFPIDQVN